ncbi:LysR family transcriptional regulator [Sphingomonas quercus]|uniref:LysR family transcriptional regulator n=1 Tax=Sphingomonas quercus TaxID=2842451 RepID=A0ABS6BGF1_9SPHN|nr:LysR family transcriptional regulator [Sphingomonas quercus]MBU3076657.1 LysR family transcriptional regulator [Sphingomonas quercus]
MLHDGRLLSGVTVLMAVVEAGSMTRAAEALGLTPSGVGRAIARLEARIGVRLLDRTTRVMRLTDEGRLFHDRVGPLLDGIEEAAAEASGAAARVRGRLRVNVDPFFSQVVLAGRVADFVARHPELALELIMRDRIGDLVADGFDLALRFGPLPGGNFVARRLFETRVVTVAAPAYVARRGRPAHPSDIPQHDVIDFWDAAHGRPYEWEFRRRDEVLPVRPVSRLITSDARTMLDACLAGAGIAQVLAFGTRGELARGELIDLFPDWPDEMFPLHAVSPSRRHRPAKVRALIDFVAELVAPLDQH